MKYLLILVVALLIVWLWRSGRRPADEGEPSDPGQRPQEMVRCGHCGIHLPRSDAVQGQRALYCSPEHLRSAEP